MDGIGDRGVELKLIVDQVIGPGNKRSGSRALGQGEELVLILGNSGLGVDDPGGLQDRHGRDDLHDPRLRQALGDLVGGHLTQGVQGRVARLVDEDADQGELRVQGGAGLADQKEKDRGGDGRWTRIAGINIFLTLNLTVMSLVVRPFLSG